MPTSERSKSGLSVVLGIALVGGLLVGCASTPGERLDFVDRQIIVTTTQEVLEGNKTGEGKNWLNPANGRRGTVMPTRTYGSSEAPCREFQQTATIDGRTIIANDAACRVDGGKWKSENYANLDGAIADEPPYHHSGYYGHHYPDYHFRYGHGRRFGHFGHFGHYW